MNKYVIAASASSIIGGFINLFFTFGFGGVWFSLPLHGGYPAFFVGIVKVLLFLAPALMAAFGALIYSNKRCGYIFPVVTIAAAYLQYCSIAGWVAMAFPLLVCSSCTWGVK